MKKHIKTIIAALVIVCVIAGAIPFTNVFGNSLDGIVVASGSENLLENGGFEASETLSATSQTGENTLLTAGWSTNSVTNVEFAVSDDANSGKRALLIKHTADGSFILRPSVADASGIISGLQSGVYSLSLYAKGSGTLQIRYRDAAVSEITSKTITLTDAYAQYGIDALVVGDTGNLIIELYSAAANGEIIVDDISLNKLSGIVNGDFESETGVTLPEAKYDFGPGANKDYNYINTNNSLINSGFEDSTYTSNTADVWLYLTEGWKAAGKVPSAAFTIGLSKDSHSGNNSLDITSTANQGGSEIRLFNDLAEADNAASQGAYSSGIAANTTYIVSYWVKGNATTRVFSKNGANFDTNNWGTSVTASNSEWTLVTHNIKSNANGQIWWNIYFSTNQPGKTALIDDVQLVTQAQAIANVVAMIDALDMSDKNAQRLVEDINQWCSKFGTASISNYSTFLQKVNGGVVSKNLLLNPGFENSDTVTNTSGKYYKDATVTEGWTLNYSNSVFQFSMSDDAHSGKNALYLSVPQATSKHGNLTFFNKFNLVYDTESTTDLEGRTTALSSTDSYIVSYWVKGTAATRAWVRSLNAATSAHSAHITGSADNVVASENKWTLVTAEFTPNSNGEIWWCINYTCDANAVTEAIIDDVSLMTVADAEAAVIEMIDDLDLNASTAEQDIDTIKQWCAKLGTENITNYADFLAKTSEYVYVDNGNLLQNPGFESSTTVNNPNVLASWSEFTNNWMNSNETRNARILLSVSNDSHSGNNALRIEKEGTSANEIRMFNSIVNTNTTDSVRDGTVTGLTQNTKYIASYWVKGDALTRIQYRGTVDAASSSYASATYYSDAEKQDKWELVTQTITADSVGIWFDVMFPTLNVTDGKYVLIDDVQLVTQAQAVANVEAMIEALDISSRNSARAVDDIEQWCAKLGANNISNYSVFTVKKNGTYVPSNGNLLQNSGFEASNEARENMPAADQWENVITAGWTTSYGAGKDVSYAISDEAHSGNNSMAVTIGGNKTDIRLFNKANLIYDVAAKGRTGGLKANTEYIVSAWVKGDASTRIWGRTVSDTNTNSLTHITTDADNIIPGNEWKLITVKLSSNANNELWWCIRMNNSTSAAATLYIDDVSLMTVADAEAAVIKMIDDLDVTATTAGQDINDIEQWLIIVNAENITNKALFEQKKAEYAVLIENAKWQPIGGVHGWITNNITATAVQGDDIAYGEKSIKITATDSQDVVLKPENTPYGFNHGYYMLVLWAKGSGELNITAKASELDIVASTEQLTSGWKKYMYADLYVPQGYSITNFEIAYTPDATGDSVVIDAVQMYRQIGPGSSLDGVAEEIIDNKLSLIGAPDGYKLTIDSVSDETVMTKAGDITTPKYNTDIEYTFSVTNINDETDVAFRKVALTVNGTAGEKPAEEISSDFAQRTLTDTQNGVSVAGNMTSDAKLNVVPLDEESQYYSSLFISGYDIQKFYNVFVIPESAVDGELTFTFDVASKYNGQTVIVSRYDKTDRFVEEFYAVVNGGKVTVTTVRDGAFMILAKPLKDTVTTPSTPEQVTPPDNINTDQKAESSDKTDNTDNTDKKSQQNDDGKTSVDGEKESDWSWLILLIIGIAAVILLLLILFTLIILIIRKRRESDEEE